MRLTVVGVHAARGALATLVGTALLACSRGPGEVSAGPQAGGRGPWNSGLIVEGEFVHEAGTVVAGAVVLHSFRIHNVSDSEVRIGRVDASCGCTSASLEHTVVPPGGSTLLDVQVNTTGRQGPLEVSVHLRANPASDAIMAALYVRAIVEEPLHVRVEPDSIKVSRAGTEDLVGHSWAFIEGHDAGTERPAVSCAIDGPLSAYVSTVVGAPVTETNATGNTVIRLPLEVRVRGDCPPGDLYDVMRVQAKLGGRSVESKATIVGTNAKAAWSTSSALFLGVVPSTEVARRSMPLVTDPTVTAADLAVRTSSDRLSCALQCETGKAGAQVVIEYTPTGVEGPIEEWFELLKGAEVLQRVSVGGRVAR